MKISAVIITKNEAHIIGTTLRSLEGLTDDIVIVDSGSTDGTTDICRQSQAKVIQPGWNGYGPNKNIGIAAARYDWILNIDADEVVDELLKKNLIALPLLNNNEVFEMTFKNFFMDKWIRHGEWGKDKHIRLFNRTLIRWNEAEVHENLTLHTDTLVTRLKGSILHYTVHSADEYERKTIAYARLNAQKYFEQGKKGNIIKQYLSPVFSFVQNYFLRLGFLDGRYGLLIAKNTARYTFLKYQYLHQLIKAAK